MLFLQLSSNLNSFCVIKEKLFRFTSLAPHISAIRTIRKMPIWWNFYIITINSPLISERQTRKSLSATSLSDRDLVPTMELKDFRGRLQKFLKLVLGMLVFEDKSRSPSNAAIGFEFMYANTTENKPGTLVLHSRMAFNEIVSLWKWEQHMSKL